MNHLNFRALTLFVSIAASALSATGIAQTPTVGVLRHEAGVSPGYTLFAPMGSKITYLIDPDGRQVHKWEAADRPGHAAYLLPNGHLLRAQVTPLVQTFNSGGAGGAVQEFDWDGTLLWDFTWSNAQHRSHHDICPMPNGNVLLISWELKTRPDYLANGRDPANGGGGPMWPDFIIEIKPTGPSTGDVVWEWHAYNHLIQDFDSTKANFGKPAENPQLIDINIYNKTIDWMHSNAIDYNPELDQVLLSAHNFAEVWVIDHSTTTAEAATHKGGTLNMGGDLLYRWGNPRNYRAGNAANQHFYGQHDAHWLTAGLRGAGNLLVFNNGLNRPDGKYSSVEEITTPIRPDHLYEWTPGTAFAPSAPTWIFTATPRESMYSDNISSVQRLPDGNTMICIGASGHFLEIDTSGNIVWEYVNPVTGAGILNQGDTVSFEPSKANNVFKCRKYTPDFPGFAGRTLTPGDVIEGHTSAADAAQPGDGALRLDAPAPNPVRGNATVRFRTAASGPISLRVFDQLGRCVKVLSDASRMEAGSYALPLSMAGLSPGLYVLELSTNGARTAKTFALER